MKHQLIVARESGGIRKVVYVNVFCGMAYRHTRITKSSNRRIARLFKKLGLQQIDDSWYFSNWLEKS